MKRITTVAVCLCLAMASAFAQDTLRIMSYNVGVFHKYKESGVEPAVAIVKEYGADVVTLNELDSNMVRTGWKYQAREFARSAGEWGYHFSRALSFPGNASYGIGVCWREGLKPVCRYSVRLPKGNGSEIRALSVVEFEEFVVATSHLDYKSEEAAVEQADIAAAILCIDYGKSCKPVFFCGDFNFEPDSKVLVRIRENFEVLTPAELSYPADNPRKCIDYICLLKNKAKVKVLESGVVNSSPAADIKTTSDHRPVFATVQILD